jgi:hypothetical protein
MQALSASSTRYGDIRLEACGIRHVMKPALNGAVMDSTSISPSETRLTERLAFIGELLRQFGDTETHYAL